MNIRIVLCLLMISFISEISAQQIRINGRVMDTEANAPAEFVNVVLQTQDSVFVTGIATDTNGKFQFDNLTSGDYRIVISAIGYTTLTTDVQGLSRTLDLGDLFLQSVAVELEVVTIKASNTVNQSDRKIIFPTEQQLKSSTNGINMLQTITLPRVQINPLTNEIKLTGDGVLQLRINGVIASAKEVSALLPADVIRIEYMDNPGLRYGNVEAVLNYITRRHESGGSVSVDLTNAPFVVFASDQISAKFNHKKSEFGLSYQIEGRDFYELWRTNEEQFVFADGSELNRYEDGKPGRYSSAVHWGALNYNYQEPDKFFFNATAKYTGDFQPHFDYYSNLYTKENPEYVIDMSDLNKSTIQMPSLDLYYQQKLKNNQTLILNVVGTYIHSSIGRTYQESESNQILTDINSQVKGNKYSIIGEGIYEKQFSKGKLNFGLKHLQATADNTYTGTTNNVTKMTQADSYAYTEFQGQTGKLNYVLGVGVSRAWLQQENEEAYETYTFRPKASLRYSFSRYLFARLSGSIVNYPPSLSELSAIDQMIDSLQVKRGNPNLKPYNQYRLNVYTEYQKGLFTGVASGMYIRSPKVIMNETLRTNDLFIRTYDNQVKWSVLNGELTAKVGMLWNALLVSLTGGVNQYSSVGNNYNHSYTNWYGRTEIYAQYKQWMGVFQLNTSRNNFWGEELIGGENTHLLMFSYQFENLSIGVGAVNPFVDNYKVTTENRNQYASNMRVNYVNESSRLYLLKLAWQFNFGRRYQAAGKRLDNTDNTSGVLGAGK